MQKQGFLGVPSVPAGQGSQTAKLQGMRFLWDQCQVIQEAITVSHMRSGSVSGWPAMWQKLSNRRHSEDETTVPRDPEQIPHMEPGSSRQGLKNLVLAQQH